MRIKQEYQNKNIAIYGMGVTGLSAGQTLKNLNANITCWDDNKKTRSKVKKFKLQKFWLSNKKIDFIVVSPGIDIKKCKIKNFLKKNLHKIITDLDIFFSLNKNTPVISITGTNGKSTTCKIIEKILKRAKYKVITVGNIGKPILSIKKVSNFFLIIEASSYQLEYSKLFRSNHAAILNISPDHLERHKNIKNYINIKSKIFYAQNNSDYAYINLSNKYLKLIKNNLKKHKVKSKIILINKATCNFILKKIKNNYFKSKGNIENLAFAYNIAKNLKIDKTTIIKAINNFRGLKHRQETIFVNKKIICVNDSKATSFEACLQSLSNYNRIYWIVGGLPKYKDSFNLKNLKKKIIKAYIIGTKTSFFENQIKKNIPYTISKNLKNAVNNIYNDVKFTKNLYNTILLSPAAASYDQFTNFEDRGVYFKKLINKKFNLDV